MMRFRPVAAKPITGEEAERIAATALVFLAEDGERLVRFLNATGLSPEELKARAASPELLAAVLDHLSEDESLLLAFTANARLDPQAIAAARCELEAAGRGRRRS